MSCEILKNSNKILAVTLWLIGWGSFHNFDVISILKSDDNDCTSWKTGNHRVCCGICATCVCERACNLIVDWHDCQMISNRNSFICFTSITIEWQYKLKFMAKYDYIWRTHASKNRIKSEERERRRSKIK